MAKRVAAGQRGRGVKLIELPIADGGDGFAEGLAGTLKAKWILATRLNNAVGKPIMASFALSADGTVIIEMAQASGIALLRRRDPMYASTFGTGELIRAARNGFGGEADFAGDWGARISTDAGTGIARALGIRFLDRTGKELPLGGIGLEKIEADRCIKA